MDKNRKTLILSYLKTADEVLSSALETMADGGILYQCKLYQDMTRVHNNTAEILSNLIYERYGE